MLDENDLEVIAKSVAQPVKEYFEREVTKRDALIEKLEQRVRKLERRQIHETP